MPLAPVDYGPQVQAPMQGAGEAIQAAGAVLRTSRDLGTAVVGGAMQLAQGVLHTQALKATAMVKERQADTLSFIDANQYVNKTDLQQRMAPEDYQAWHDKLGPEYKDVKAVPMYTVAPDLFDSEAKKARADASQMIALPGWRSQWDATERTESSTIRERYVNRIAADQMIADQRAQTLMAGDRMIDSAMKPEDIQAAADFYETSPWLKPPERRFAVEKALVAKDSFVARHAMLGNDTDVMGAELKKLQGPDAAKLFPNMNEKQRLDLANQLGREHSFNMAKNIAEQQIVGPNVSETGKVDRTAIAEKLAKYSGPNKEDVTKAVKTEEAAKLDIFDKKTAEIQQSILRAGQDPLTGRFSYAKAMQNPDARKAAFQLNQDAPGLITALSREDQRNENIDAKATAVERREAKAALVERSQGNLDTVHKNLDDEAQSDYWKSRTGAQFDSYLHSVDMTESDRDKARKAFAQFQKNGGKPDERAKDSVKAEIFAAANGDKRTADRIAAKLQDQLLQSAHAFIRTNAVTLQGDKMTDALRAHLKGEMLGGTVAGTGVRGSTFFEDHVRRIQWETNPKYVGKEFKADDGSISKPSEQRVFLSKGKQSGYFSAADAAAARNDGWK
jgi:hypothetical protein